MKKETSNITYVSIKDPVAFRRHILLSGIDAIKILEKYELLKQIKNEKRKLFSQLKEKLLGLKSDAMFIREYFPDVNEHEIKKEKKIVERKVDDVKYADKTINYKNLQKDLRELQDKLNNLNF